MIKSFFFPFHQLGIFFFQKCECVSAHRGEELGARDIVILLPPITLYLYIYIKSVSFINYSKNRRFFKTEICGGLLRSFKIGLEKLEQILSDFFRDNVVQVLKIELQ